MVNLLKAIIVVLMMNKKVNFLHSFNQLLIKIKHAKSKLIIKFAIQLLEVDVAVLISLATQNLLS